MTGIPLRRPRDPKNTDPVGITVAKDRLDYTLDHHIEETLALAYDLLGKVWSWLPDLIEDGDGDLVCPHCRGMCDDSDEIKTWDTGHYPIYTIDSSEKQITHSDHEGDYDNDYIGYRCNGCGKLSRVPDSWSVESY